MRSHGVGAQAEAQAVRQGLLSARRAVEMYGAPAAEAPAGGYASGRVAAAERPRWGGGGGGGGGEGLVRGPGAGTGAGAGGGTGGGGDSPAPTKLWSFGLGHADEATIRAVQAQHPDMQPSRLLMPRRRLAESVAEGDGAGWAPIEVPPARGGAWPGEAGPRLRTPRSRKRGVLVPLAARRQGALRLPRTRLP